MKSATAYADDQGVFNIYLMDKEGNDVCHYDPENYGKGTFSDDFKHELGADEEIIGVYGTLPRPGEKLFSSFGFVILQTSHPI